MKAAPPARALEHVNERCGENALDSASLALSKRRPGLSSELPLLRTSPLLKGKHNNSKNKLTVCPTLVFGDHQADQAAMETLIKEGDTVLVDYNNEKTCFLRVGKKK